MNTPKSVPTKRKTEISSPQPLSQSKSCTKLNVSLADIAAQFDAVSYGKTGAKLGTLKKSFLKYRSKSQDQLKIFDDDLESEPENNESGTEVNRDLSNFCFLIKNRTASQKMVNVNG